MRWVSSYLQDNFIAKFRIQIKGKELWCPLLVNFLYVVNINAWMLYRIVSNSDNSVIQSQRIVATSVLKPHLVEGLDIIPETHNIHKGQKSNTEFVLQNIIKDNKVHLCYAFHNVRAKDAKFVTII